MAEIYGLDAAFVAYRRGLERVVLSRLLDAHVSSRSLALDLGCGDGVWSRWLAAHFHEVVGLERSERLLQVCREQPVEGVSFGLHDLGRQALPRLRPDVIFLGGVLMYLDDEQVKNVVHDALRLLAPGGVLIARESVHPLRDTVTKRDGYEAMYRKPSSYRRLLGTAGARRVLQVDNPGYNAQIYCIALSGLLTIASLRRPSTLAHTTPRVTRALLRSPDAPPVGMRWLRWALPRRQIFFVAAPSVR